MVFELGPDPGIERGRLSSIMRIDGFLGFFGGPSLPLGEVVRFYSIYYIIAILKVLPQFNL
jgi:hypothetical protein